MLQFVVSERRFSRSYRQKKAYELILAGKLGQLHVYLLLCLFDYISFHVIVMIMHLLLANEWNETGQCISGHGTKKEDNG